MTGKGELDCGKHCVFRHMCCCSAASDIGALEANCVL